MSLSQQRANSRFQKQRFLAPWHVVLVKMLKLRPEDPIPGVGLASSNKKSVRTSPTPTRGINIFNCSYGFYH